MAQGSSDGFRPKTILIQGAATGEASTTQELDDEGLPPPVKAIASHETSDLQTEGNIRLIGLGLMLVFLSLLLVLFLSLAPSNERENYGFYAGTSLILGLGGILLGMLLSRPVNKASPPKPIAITAQRNDNETVVPSAVVDEPETPSAGDVNETVDGARVDDQEGTDSFWASMLEDRTGEVVETTKQTQKEIPISNQGLEYALLLAMVMAPFGFAIFLVGGPETCGILTAFCIPELVLLSLFGDSKTKSTPVEVVNQGTNALLVIVSIMFLLLMIVFFA